MLFQCNNPNVYENKEQYIILKTGQYKYLYENRYSKKSKEDFISCLSLNYTSKKIEMSYFVPFIVHDPHTKLPWTTSKLICIRSKSCMISPIDPRGKSGLLLDLFKYRYLSNASTVCDEILTIYTQDNAEYNHV